MSYRQQHQPLAEVVVCSSCKRASCAQAVWPCLAPTKAIKLPIDTVRALDKEHPDFWTGEWARAAAQRAKA